jgi:PEP-CTERM motif
MKRTVFVAFVSLTFAMSSLYATTQNLSLSGPTTWTPGTSVVLAVQDTYSGYGAGSYGSSYWLQVNTSLAPFLTITGLVYYPPFPIGYNGSFPIRFDSTSGSDPGFTCETVDLGAEPNPPDGSYRITDRTFGPDAGAPVPDGSYHITDITFGLAAGAPAGTYTLRTTTTSPRVSVQITSDSGDAAFPQASFVFTVVPEPSTLALIALTGIGAGVMAYRRRR